MNPQHRVNFLRWSLAGHRRATGILPGQHISVRCLHVLWSKLHQEELQLSQTLGEPKKPFFSSLKIVAVANGKLTEYFTGSFPILRHDIHPRIRRCCCIHYRRQPDANPAVPRFLWLVLLHLPSDSFKQLTFGILQASTP